ncbi:MAG: glyoxylate/hydroxypyruvate reductase A [Silicimonas sp.]|nr:glyoxylate/hydroxypyruvate reductase A [Silicimonas sp.]
MITALFSASNSNWDKFSLALREAFSSAGLEVDLTREADPSDVDYIIYAPNSTLQDFTPFTNLKGVLSLWAGVESAVNNPTLTVPFTRMVSDGLSEGMVEWCVGHVLRHHLGMDRDICRGDAVWDPVIPPLARDRPVTILGLGALGQAVAEALIALNFPVTGWSRSLKEIDGVTCLSGNAGLAEALKDAEIVVLLLPMTPQTENVLDADRLSLLARGAFVINPGRGPLIDDEALVSALDLGQVAHATLDVFRVEPLPEDHPFWAHPQVTVTPHIASDTRADTAAAVIAENIRRGEAGEPFLHLVDRKAGY